MLQNLITFLKVLLMVGICVTAAANHNCGWLPKNFDLSKGLVISSVSGLGRGVVACLWAFDGWADLGSLAEEMVEPGRTLPRVIFMSVSVVLVLYLCVNVAYLSVLSLHDMKKSDNIAIALVNAVGAGIPGTVSIAIGVALSALGALHGTTMTGGRVFYAVARDGGTPFPRFLGVLNESGAPARALAAQCVWAMFLILLPGSSFSSLLDYFGPTSYVLYSATTLATLRLRYHSSRRHNEYYFYDKHNRPYTMPLSPLPPLLVLAASIYLVTSALVTSPFYCSAALAFSAAGFPIFVLHRRCMSKEPIEKVPTEEEGDEPPCEPQNRHRGNSQRDVTVYDDLGKSLLSFSTNGSLSASA